MTVTCSPLRVHSLSFPLLAIPNFGGLSLTLHQPLTLSTNVCENCRVNHRVNNSKGIFDLLGQILDRLPLSSTKSNRRCVLFLGTPVISSGVDMAD